jgi:predicted AAA+ superfamily ATPase
MLDMKRLALDKLVKWKNADNRKPLVLNGARQVGKTYLLKNFGKQFYRKIHYLNFEDDEFLHKIFEHSLKPQKIIDALKIDFELDIDIESDLIFFDEIQACPKALTSLKYFCEDLPQVHSPLGR